MQNKTNSEIVALAREKYFSDVGTHGWDHTERVVNLALHIGKTEGANLEIVELAAYLHDIAREKQDKVAGKICHAEEGAKEARTFLAGFGLNRVMIEKIAHCIETHRFRNDKKPASLEARVIYDADKLDSIGAVGIGRAFLFSGEVGAKLHTPPDIDIFATEAYGPDDTAYREYMHKLRHVHEKMLTAEGKRLAAGRHDFMVDFFARMQREIAGEI